MLLVLDAFLLPGFLPLLLVYRRLFAALVSPGAGMRRGVAAAAAAALSVAGFLLVVYYAGLATPLDSLVQMLVCRDSGGCLCFVKGLHVYRLCVHTVYEPGLLSGLTASGLYLGVVVEPSVSVVDARLECGGVAVGNVTVGVVGGRTLITVRVPLEEGALEALRGCERVVLRLEAVGVSWPSICRGGVCLGGSSVSVELPRPWVGVSGVDVECTRERCEYVFRLVVENGVAVLFAHASPVLRVGDYTVLAEDVELEGVEGGGYTRRGSYILLPPGNYTLVYRGGTSSTFDALRVALRRGESLEACLAAGCGSIDPLELARSISPWFFEGAYAVYEGGSTITGLYVTLLSVHPIIGHTSMTVRISVSSIEGDKATLTILTRTELDLGLVKMPVERETRMTVDVVEGYKPAGAVYKGVETVRVGGVERRCLVYEKTETRSNGNVKTTTVFRVYVDSATRWPVRFWVKIVVRAPLLYAKGEAILTLRETNIPGLR